MLKTKDEHKNLTMTDSQASSGPNSSQTLPTMRHDAPTGINENNANHVDERSPRPELEDTLQTYASPNKLAQSERINGPAKPSLIQSQRAVSPRKES